MLKQSKHQAGFGLVAVIALILVAGVVVSGGLLVNNRISSRQNTEQRSNSSEVDSTAQTPSAASDESRPAEEREVEKYAVAELGVTFDVPSTLQKGELIHFVRDIQLSDGTSTKAAYFSTKQLVRQDPKCSAENVSIAAMAIGDGRYPSESQNVAIDYGPLLKQFTDKFVTFMTSRASCVEGKGVEARKLHSEVQAELVNSVKSVEFIN